LSTIGRGFASVALAAAAAGCGSDSTAPKGQSALTSEQAVLVASGIFEEVSVALSKSGFAGQVAPSAARFSSVPLTGSATLNAPCTNGGSVGGTYTYSEDIGTNGSGTATGSMDITMTGCKVSTGTDLIAVSGALNYTFSFAFSQSAALDTFDWHGSGSFNWSGGSCSLDYTVHYTGAAGGKDTISGTVCGVNVSETT
ncbi:MAG: hypothetical protein ACHQWU_10090, partial [Gemmatimonadales bacterium]